ncbi:MAG: GNAT family N-acetyltransferase [Cyclobacteriaceae bacterium]|nr:GNAT family N-acetyltransferase [Cyclobacteriaceae bacterium]UYN87667.1 MAG: GNAT family N-acetyltransferase [Cyclobacteriaceae bacterium]
MQQVSQNIIIKKLDQGESIPYDLLLLADPSKKKVDEYLEKSEVFVAMEGNEILGVLTLYPLTEDTVEIKNVAVKFEFQGQGIGSFLIKDAIHRSAIKKLKTILIGTANSSIWQLCLYQKLGFEITDIKRNFFIQNYPEPIFENAIQARHMIVLSLKLTDQA